MSSQGLPPGWSMGYDSITGFPFFIDHINKSTTWEDPRKSKTQSNITQNLQSVPSYSSESINNRRQYNLPGNEPVIDPSNPGDIKLGNVGDNIQRKIQSHYDNVSEPIPIKVHSISSSNNNNNNNNNNNSNHHEYEQKLNNTPATQSFDSYKPNQNSSTNKSESIPIKSVSVKISDDNNNNNDNNENVSQPTTSDPFSLIEQAQCELAEIETEISGFTSSYKTKAYLLLEDKLDKLMLRLDKIDSSGETFIRNKRREVILAVQNALKNLESKLTQIKSDNQEHDISLTDQSSSSSNNNNNTNDNINKQVHSSIDSREIHIGSNEECQNK
ncbi:unnamed protein product [Schistosoma intercalatum]|nr:unnamed protein product [Schistosoma intercalatum]